MVGKSFAVGAFASLIAASVASCALIVDIHPRSAAIDACAECNDRSCAAQVQACRADEGCNIWIDCNDACEGDSLDECRAHCAAAVLPGDSDALIAVQACRASSCATDCAVSCGGIPIPTPETSAQSCNACIAQKCCSESQACSANGECWSIVACLRRSGGPDNDVACAGTEHPGGAAAKRLLDQCVTNGCATECALGSYWGCIGKMSWPAATKTSITATYHLTDTSQARNPVPGLHVRACPRTDIDCASPYTTTALTTDATGTVQITLPMTTPAGFDGYLEVIDPNSDPATAYEPTLIYEGAPLADDLPKRELPLFTVATLHQLAAVGQITLDPERGIVGAAVVDCAGLPAPGMTVAIDTMDPSTRLFYFRGQIPNPTVNDTDATGTVALVNVRAGAAKLTATSEQLRQDMTKTPIIVRKSAMTLVGVIPNPG